MRKNPLLMTVGNPKRKLTKAELKLFPWRAEPEKPWGIYFSTDRSPFQTFYTREEAQDALRKEKEKLSALCRATPERSGRVVDTSEQLFIAPVRARERSYGRGGQYRKPRGMVDYGFNPCGSKKNPVVKRTRSYDEMKRLAKGLAGRKISSKKMDRIVGTQISYLDYLKSQKKKKLASLNEGEGPMWNPKYARNEAGFKPFSTSKRTSTISFQKGREFIYRYAPPAEIRRFEAQVRAFRQAHGADPTTITRKVIDVGGRVITDRDYTYSFGVTPESTYTVPNRSAKAKQSKHWKHEWKLKNLHTEVFPGGKVIMNASRGAKLIKKGWMDA